ncbi:MAG: hydrolase 1, exosortase A system-associated [Pseudomonadota bacterium]
MQAEEVTVGEAAVSFQCAGDRLVGILHRTPEPTRRGVLIVVGGPQYRIGAHRQFVSLARKFCAEGIPVFRFDARGMGDSDGELQGFESISQDIAAAIDAFQAAEPGIERVVLWGLCDGASAAAFYGHQDPRVAGMVLVNPWVRSEATQAEATLKHHYGRRIADPETWRRLASGKISLGQSIGSIAGSLRTSIAARVGTAKVAASLPERVIDAIDRFEGPILLVLCGNDFTAQEFLVAARKSDTGRQVLEAPRVTQRHLPEANHTFSKKTWRDEIAAQTISWLGDL